MRVIIIFILILVILYISLKQLFSENTLYKILNACLKFDSPDYDSIEQYLSTILDEKELINYNITGSSQFLEEFYNIVKNRTSNTDPKIELTALIKRYAKINS